MKNKPAFTGKIDSVDIKASQHSQKKHAKIDKKQIDIDGKAG